MDQAPAGIIYPHLCSNLQKLPLGLLLPTVTATALQIAGVECNFLNQVPAARPANLRKLGAKIDILRCRNNNLLCIFTKYHCQKISYISLFTNMNPSFFIKFYNETQPSRTTPTYYRVDCMPIKASYTSTNSICIASSPLPTYRGA